MVVERFRPGAAERIYARLRAQGRMMPAGLEYLDSWIDLPRERCWQLMRAESPDLFAPWIAAWSDLMEFEVVAVQTSAEAAAR